jgi:hypothetical protein
MMPTMLSANHPRSLLVKEIIHGRHRADLGQQAQGHQRHHGKGIEIGIVVAGKHGRAVGGEPVAVAHGEAKRDQDHRAHDDGEEQEPQQPDQRVLAHG